MDREAQIHVNEVSFALRNFVKGNEVSRCKQSCEMEVDGQIFNCILMNKNRGRFADICAGIKGSMTIGIHQQQKTKYTKSGYFVILLTFKSAQLWLYIKRSDLPRFYIAVLPR